MENENKTPVEQTSTPVATEEKNQVAYESYQKVLSEKKSAQAKAEAALARAEELENENLSRTGKQDELIEKYKKQISELEGNLTKTKQSYGWNTVKSELSRIAQLEGCTNPDKLIKLMSDDDLNAIEVGENFAIDTESVKKVIERNKKDNHFLFKTTQSAVVNSNPNNKISTKEKEMDISKLSIEELKARILQNK